ncbi:MAG: nitroreductase [Porticoccaceae bacterium]|nr:nitroreductase [Porticoccaceae bacterium]
MSHATKTTHPKEMMKVLGVDDIQKAFFAHIGLYLTDPEKAHMLEFSAVGSPRVHKTLLLETTGRDSGKARLAPLVYLEYGDTYTLIGTNAGATTHPHWAKNLMANPHCHIRVASRQFDAVARVVEGDERENLYAMWEQAFEPIAQYKYKTAGRVIPVFVLDDLTPTN